MTRHRRVTAISFAFVALAICAASVQAQITGYGVNSTGQLFRFNVNAAAPAPVTNIGAPLPFVPEGIDFRPSTSTLYAIDVGPNTTQLYTINTTTGVASTVGSGFTSTGTVPGTYSLIGNQTFGFDFNPKTLQASDGSIRIRLVSSNGQNLRLNSDTGQIAAVDLPIAYIPAIATSVDAAAYINNVAATTGTTALYDLDFRNNVLALQNPPNNGTLTSVGPFGAAITILPGSGFDIYTDPASVDDTIGGDTAFAVIKRADAPIGGPLGAYLLYDVNLGTGAITNGRLVGSAAGADFTGGFAVIPEPSSIVLALIGTAAVAGSMRSRRRVK